MMTLLVHLWAFPGLERELSEYEDEVLRLLGDHDATLVSRVRAREISDHATEVHVIRFASEEALERYMTDPRRMAMSDRRDRLIESTLVQRVDLIE
jgi:antibiotic biosynthesis monooxygenase (ABM) superfamily enzyme